MVNRIETDGQTVSQRVYQQSDRLQSKEQRIAEGGWSIDIAESKE